MNFPKSAYFPGTVFFEETECHVMHVAWQHHRDRMHEEFGAYLTEHIIDLWGDIFQNSRRLYFSPSQDERIFYTHLAKYGFEQIQNETGALFCDHTDEEHRIVLHKIIGLLATSHRNN